MELLSGREPHSICMTKQALPALNVERPPNSTRAFKLVQVNNEYTHFFSVYFKLNIRLYFNEIQVFSQHEAPVCPSPRIFSSVYEITPFKTINCQWHLSRQKMGL